MPAFTPEGPRRPNPVTGAEQPSLHPAWAELIRFCRELRHGEIENLKIQDGIPQMAELVRKKVRFTE
jgi:hypothetical protein